MPCVKSTNKQFWWHICHVYRFVSRIMCNLNVHLYWMLLTTTLHDWLFLQAENNRKHCIIMFSCELYCVYGIVTRKAKLFKQCHTLLHIITLCQSMAKVHNRSWLLIIRLEARLQPNIGTPYGPFLRCSRAFGYNSTESEPIWMKSVALLSTLPGWPWQILGAIRAVARVGQPGEILIFVFLR